MTIIRFIDLETTGIGPDAEVCEIGYTDFHLEAREFAGPISQLYGVSRMPPEARAVHNISAAMCEGFPPFDGNISQVGIQAIAAHNIEFDGRFFTARVPMICTYKSALRVWPGAPKHSKDVLRCWLEDAGKLRAPESVALPSHRAGPDSFVGAQILMALFNEGATGREMVAWTKEPALMPVCPIGKFNGMPWSEVEGGFLGWMVRHPDMEADLKWNAHREIERRAEQNG